MPIEAPRQHGAMEYTEAPIDLDLVRRYRLGRLRAELKQRDYAGLLLFDPINTRYATDATNTQIWCAHYETRCVFVATEGPVVLFDYANLPHLAEDLPLIDEYRALPSFYYFTAGPRAAERAKMFGDQIADLVQKHGGGRAGCAAPALRRWPVLRVLAASHWATPPDRVRPTSNTQPSTSSRTRRTRTSRSCLESRGVTRVSRSSW